MQIFKYLVVLEVR